MEALNSGNPQLQKQDEPAWKPVKLTGPGQGEVSVEFCFIYLVCKIGAHCFGNYCSCS